MESRLDNLSEALLEMKDLFFKRDNPSEEKTDQVKKANDKGKQLVEGSTSCSTIYENVL